MDRVYPSAKRQRLDTQPEEDSDYCIIVEPTGPNSTAKKNVLNRVAEFEDDEIVFIGETGGQVGMTVLPILPPLLLLPLISTMASHLLAISCMLTTKQTTY